MTKLPSSHNTSVSLPAPSPRVRISAKTRKAIALIATQGKTQRQAAKLAGMNESALSRALAQPHVKNALEQAKADYIAGVQAIRTVHKARAIEVAAELMDNAKSESVRMRAVEFFAGEMRGPAVQVTVNTGQKGYEYVPPNARVIEIEAEPDSASPDTSSEAD